ncbi:uncharacterized protein LOC105015621 isoform X2 [Esox lucius]|uniref:Zona pellucida sperm-binding protein 3 n=1 Tax=Esox lucius TaxID=8010 RepID=A0A3P8ZGC4_ESOLU|nr:uncharacterized protein LOC105015621 isoform X1 [Esox lucius]XP_034153217.1 uncharacterized protein LOC105015621 isoform X2 [Esox lucius]
MRADRKLGKGTKLFAMKTKWLLYILWSVFSLRIANATFGIYESSYVSRPVGRRNILKLGTSKGVGDTLKAHLSPTENRKSSLRIPSHTITFTTSQPTHEFKQSSSITYSSPQPRGQHRMLLSTPAPKSELGFASLPDVSVTCSSDDFVVRVKRAFYGFHADSEELTLGSTCKSNGVLMPYGDLLFAYSMTECDGKREMPPGYLIYKFVLHYAPQTTFPRDAHRVNIDIECRFQRYFHVYQRVVRPTWETPIVRKRLKGRTADFRIQLMDDVWSMPAKSQVYILGQTVHFQVSALHLPHGGKLFINHCYATTSSDPKTSRKLTVIDNFGCMRESQKNVGGSEFVLPNTDDTVRFSISAFQFTSDPDTPVFLHCKLHVTSNEYGPMHKFCTYKDNRWWALTGEDSVCDCCDSKCVTSKPRRAMVEGFASSEALLFSDQPSTPRGSVSQVRPSPVYDDEEYVWFETKLDGKIDEFDNPDHLPTFDGNNHGDEEEQSYSLFPEKEKQHVEEDEAVPLEGERSQVLQTVFTIGKIFRGAQGSGLRDTEITGEAPGLRAKEGEELTQDFPLESERVGLRERRPWEVGGPESMEEEASGENRWIHPQESSSMWSGVGDKSESQEEVVSQSTKEWGLRVGDEQLLELPKDEGGKGSEPEQRDEEGKTVPVISEALEEILGDNKGLVESTIDSGKDLPRVWYFKWR